MVRVIKMDGMRVRYTGRDRALELTNGKMYSVVSIERDWYRIDTDMMGDYLYPPELFEIVDAGKEVKDA